MSELQSNLPISIDWYRQAAVWLVSLSTGAIALSLSISGKISLLNPLTIILFLLTGLAFFIAIFSGIRLYFWLNSYAIHLENKNKIENRSEETSENDHENKKSDILNAQGKKAQQRIGLYNQFLLWSFSIGALLLFVSISFSVLGNKAQQKFVMVNTSEAKANNSVANQVILLNENTGQSWILVKDTSNTYSWVSIKK